MLFISYSQKAKLTVGMQGAPKGSPWDNLGSPLGDCSLIVFHVHLTTMKLEIKLEQLYRTLVKFQESTDNLCVIIANHAQKSKNYENQGIHLPSLPLSRGCQEIAEC